jgi:hypothetical protein
LTRCAKGFCRRFNLDLCFLFLLLFLCFTLFKKEDRVCSYLHRLGRLHKWFLKFNLVAFP